MVFVLLVFVIFSVFACKFIHDKSVKWSKLKIPRREKYPFIVEFFYPLFKLAFTSAEERFQAIKDYNEPFPDLLKCWVGPEMLINVNGPDRVQKVMMSTECSEKPKLVYNAFGFGSGLITASTKNMWKAHRKFFNFSFSLSILEGFLPTFVDHSDNLTEKLLKESNKSEFNFFDYAKKTSFDILYATSLGGNIKEFRNQPIYEKVFDAFESIELAVSKKLSIPFLYPQTLFKLTKLYREEQKARKFVDKLQKDIRASRRKAMTDQSTKPVNDNEDQMGPLRNTLLDHIILNEEKFTSEEIHDHMMTFVSAYETWTNGLAHAMLLIAMHPEVQEKLYQEIQKEFPSDDGLKSSEKISSLEFLDLVVKEALRLMPSVPMIARQPLEDFEIEPGLVFPKDTSLLINIFAMHRRKDIWGDDAGEFKPERFLPENSSTRHRFAYLPFSGGPRMCIAYKYSTISMKVAIIKMIRSLKFSSSMKMSDIRLKSYMSLKLCTPHLMSVQKRCA